MKNKFILLTIVFTALAGLTVSLDAYWVDEYGVRHYHDGVVRDSADAAGDVAATAVDDTGYVLGGLFGAHRHYDGPSDHYCRHHQFDPAC